ncbi:DUF305 domain-containing protein [Streptomyces sp. NPDC006339]|uniref:DUF305 domain-containing protein n=1 Tax=Streptomyces sp. NPDC006339 TaxID=3156755 RepID=UPI0033AD0765
MTQNPLRRRAAVAAVATVLSLALAPASFAAGGPGPERPTSTTSQDPQPLSASPAAYELGEELAGLAGKQLEVTFLAAVIPHHRAAVEMAKLERERGVDADVRNRAEHIISGQQHQIDRFTRWLHEWYGLTPQQARAQAPAEAREEMAEMDKETRKRVDELRRTPAGKGFDTAFLRRIIPHHSEGIAVSLEVQSRAVHHRLREAASTGIAAQQAEIEDFRDRLGRGRK